MATQNRAGKWEAPTPTDFRISKLHKYFIVKNFTKYYLDWYPSLAIIKTIPTLYIQIIAKYITEYNDMHT